MDFEYTVKEYTPELEEFRKEVQQWLKENVPAEMHMPKDDGDDITEDQHRLWDMAAELRRKLGAKRWLYPTMPYKYGGGGLSADHASIIREELTRRGAPVLHSVDHIFGPIFVWATDEQKERFLPGIIRGETITMQAFTEPQGGSDLANIKSTAVRDGEEWLLNGTKTFCTGYSRFTRLLYGPFLTDPDAPRHRNLGFFLIPRETPGVTLIPLRLLNGTDTNMVIFDNVRIPANNLVGGDHQGWQVTQTLLEEEHGGAPTDAAGAFRDDSFNSLGEFVRSTNGSRNPLANDPLVQERLADLYIDSRIGTLWRLRNFSMYRAGQELTYQGSQSSAFGKESSPRQAGRIRDVMGPYALLKCDDPLAPLDGRLERRQRGSLATHPGGTTEVQKVIVARRLGMSRTQERPAPTMGTVAAS